MVFCSNLMLWWKRLHRRTGLSSWFPAGDDCLGRRWNFPGNGDLLEKVREEPTSCSGSTSSAQSHGTGYPTLLQPRRTPSHMISYLELLASCWVSGHHKKSNLAGCQALGPQQMVTYTTAQGGDSSKATSKLVTKSKLDSRCSHAYHKSSQFQTRDGTPSNK